MTPKHQIVRDHIEHLIDTGEIKAGDALPGEMELSRDLDVSRNTIRHALDQLSRTYHIERTRGRGTIFYGHQTPSTTAKSVGFINSSVTYTIYPGMIHGLEEGLFQGGFSMILANGNYDPVKEQESARRMLAQGVSGIIVEPMISAQLTAESDFVKLLNNAGVPILTTNCTVSGLHASYITMNDYWIGTQAAEYLLRHNHQRIGCIYKADPGAGHLRAAGFRDRLRTAGIEPEESLFISYTQEDEPLVPGVHFTRNLLESSDPPTAIFYFNDQIAVQAYELFRDEEIRVPQDLSIIAVDNIAEAGHVRPGLTTFHHPKELMGKLAADVMLNQLSAPSQASAYGISLEPPLIERGSVSRQY
ncbi:MAG TPA: GntR family transcriptional regulator [Alkalispirochaeta sp.]|nr:GntR family transcriptional regulator [Alkalispirochaeta sp.]